MPGRKAGRLKLLYVNSATYASPTWVLMGKVSDVDVTMAKASTDIDIRETGNTKTVGGNLKIGLTFNYHRVDELTDAVFTALSASYFTNSVLDMAAMEAVIATAGSKGIRGPFVVTGFTRKEPINGSVFYEVELQETDDYSTDGATAYFAGPYTVAAPPDPE